MDVNADILGPVDLGSFLIVLARGAGFAGFAPAWGVPGLDWRIRLGLAAALALIVSPLVNGLVGPGPSDPVALGRDCAGELLLGAALGMAAGMIVASARQAGEIVGIQAGFSPAAILDPEAGEPLTPIGHLYGMVATAAFLALDGPMTLVHALAESYEQWPPGGPSLSVATISRAFVEVQAALGLALRVASPVALALMLAGFALGLLGRAAPALQALTLALPARTAIGLILVFLGLGTLVGLVSGAWADLPARLAMLPPGP
ncbi:MAG: flagellar biosynthetic protein FliR [Isosphaeraceae bacterium]